LPKKRQEELKAKNYFKLMQAFLFLS